MQCQREDQLMDPPRAMHCPAVCETAAVLFSISFPKALTVHQARLRIGICRCCARIGNEQILWCRSAKLTAQWQAGADAVGRGVGAAAAAAAGHGGLPPGGIQQPAAASVSNSSLCPILIARDQIYCSK